MLRFGILGLAVVALFLTGCKSMHPDKPPSAPAPTGETSQKAKTAKGEATLEEFLSSLRSAAANHDMVLLASLMTTNFGYQLEPPLEGDGVFQYLDEHALWQELALVVAEPFVPMGAYRVAPAAFAKQPEQFKGYRAGVVQVGGRWRFAYFVNG